MVPVVFHGRRRAAPLTTGPDLADGSFEEFYHATYGRLLRQIVLVTGDRGDAEDLVQDVYGRAAVRWRRLRDYQAPEA